MSRDGFDSFASATPADPKTGPGFFSRLFRPKAQQRMDQNDWAAQYFQFQGNAYPISQGAFNAGIASESIENDFESYVSQAVKASGIVFACIAFRMAVFTEARFKWQRMRDGRPGDLYGDPSLHLLEHPWLNAQSADLLARAMQDVDVGGNFYCVREGLGTDAKPYTLRRLRPDYVDILLTEAPDQAVRSDISGYLYRPGGTYDKEKWIVYPIDGSNGIVAHWAPLPDPAASYRGMSWITPVLPEITSDRAAVRHKQKFFEHAATPPIVVSFKDTVTDEQFKTIMGQVNRGHAGVENAYKTMYLGGGADVKVIGASLAQIDFAKTAGHGEARIMAAAGIHPLILGLSEQQVRTALSVSNLEAAKGILVDGRLRPMWRSLCDSLTVLLPSKGDGSRLWYDDRDIPFLREDRRAVADIKQTEAETAGGLINNGFTPDSVKVFMLTGDWRLLEHTGLVSVQLQAPGAQFGANTSDPGAPGNVPALAPGTDANTPDKTDKKPKNNVGGTNDN